MDLDLLLVILAILCPLIGIVGSILPAIPGMPVAWLGLLAFKYTKYSSLDWSLIWISLGIVLVFLVLDYFIPIYSTQKSGGTKYGSWGAMIGLLIGFCIPVPFAFLLGLILGAFIGEIIHNQRDLSKATKSAIASFIGFLASTMVKLVICFSFLGYILYDLIF